MRRSAVAVAAIVVAIGCGPGPIVRHGKINEPALDRVARGLERVRGLRFTTPVPGRVLTTRPCAACSTTTSPRSSSRASSST
jgi:hypothetical protein